MKLSEIAKVIGAEFHGDDKDIIWMNTVQDASSNELSFVSNSKYIKEIARSKAGAIIVNESSKDYVPQGTTALIVEDTYWQMAVLTKYFASPLEDLDSSNATVGEGSVISPKAELAKGAKIGKNTTIIYK